MDDSELLRHLLDLESEAAALVDDAQAEADRRVAEGEKKNRERHDEVYAEEVRALEASFTETVADTKNKARKQLEAYEAQLKAAPCNTEAFFSLAEKLLELKEP